MMPVFRILMLVCKYELVKLILEKTKKIFFVSRMDGATRSGYYILNSQTEPESLRIAHCNMNLPFFDERMEKDIGKLSLAKPGGNLTNFQC